MFLRPQPGDAVISRNSLQTFPEMRSNRIRYSKIRIGFTVDPGVTFDDLTANAADNFAFRILSDLKFGESFFQVSEPLLRTISTLISLFPPFAPVQVPPPTHQPIRKKAMFQQELTKETEREHSAISSVSSICSC